MLPTGHSLSGYALVFRFKNWSTLKLCAFALLLHIPLDAFPHLEPGLHGGLSDYTHPSSWKFWWAAGDILITAVIAVWLSRQFPEYGRKIFAVLCCAVAPDLLPAWVNKQLPGYEHLSWYMNFHLWLHWWKSGPLLVIVPVGTAYWLGVCWFSLAYLRRASLRHDPAQEQFQKNPVHELATD